MCEEERRLLSMDELKETKSDEEINEFCVTCGACCFYGPAACVNLTIIDEGDLSIGRQKEAVDKIKAELQKKSSA